MLSTAAGSLPGDEDLRRRDRETAETLTLLETLVSRAPFGFGFVDRDFRMVRVNEMLASVNGKTVAEHLGQFVADIVPELWPQLECLYRHVLDDGEAVLDIPIVGPAPTDPAQMRKWLLSLYPVPLNGEIIGIGIVVVDVTEGNRAALFGVSHELEASQRRLASAQRIAHIGSFEYEIATGEMTCSEEHYRVLGVDPTLAPTTALFVTMVHPDDLPGVIDAWAKTSETGVPLDVTCRLIRPDSEERWVRMRAEREVDDDGTVLRVVGTLMDETERVNAERERREAETRFEIGFEQSAIGSSMSDLAGLPIRVNPALCRFLGRTAEDILGRRSEEYMSGGQVPMSDGVRMRLAAGHDTFEGEASYLRPDGQVVWGASNLTLVRDESGAPQYFFTQIQDITGRKQMEHDLAHQALHDSLTGLPNRTLLTDRMVHGLAGSRRRGSQLGVLFLDVDRLKEINDSLGHTAGDELLRFVAGRIAGAIRPGDTVARLGGDEFVVVCDDVSGLEAEEIAERVLEALNRPCLVGEEEVQITASIGIAIADSEATPATLLRDSDAAMYRAKERGRCRIELFDDDLRTKAERRSATESALQRALEREEFTVLYQPIIDLSTGAMVSAEALLRWEQPDHGLVSPQEFVPLAEETGLIVPIGAWVLEQACTELAGWRRAMPTMSVAVNLSVRQLYSADIAGRVSAILLRTGARAEALCLELTESVFMEDFDYFGRALDSIKALGVRLAIDDFGTGYSSLGYLKRFPLDAVKVDRVFVEGLGTDRHDSALVAAIVAMGDALGLEVTAEGVETQQQLVDLKRLGCRRAQGFLLARPMSAEAMRRLVAEDRHWPVD